MPVIASVNLNKRINNPVARIRLENWLKRNEVRILLAQEPWNTHGADLNGWTPLGGNDRVFAWIDLHCKLSRRVLVEDFWQRIELGDLVVYSVYLDAYSKSARARQLGQLYQVIINEENRPVLLVGDFNIAPSSSEGLFAGIPSLFNSKVDREPLLHLLFSARLIDLSLSPKDPEWTIERNMKGRQVQFRCDLAFASDYIVNIVKFHYDHSTRAGDEPFTDHSGILISVPFNVCEDIYHVVRPERTAIHRKDASQIAQQMMILFQKNPSIKSVLDYGCGYGKDVNFYRKIGMQAEGYDPYPLFGWARQPTGKYDLITLTYVLNVLPTPWERLQAFAEAKRYLSSDGIIVVATRSPSEITKEAKKKRWATYNDGYMSHKGKSTFQRGISREEILMIASRLGLEQSPYDCLIKTSSATSCVVLQQQKLDK